MTYLPYSSCQRVTGKIHKLKKIVDMMKKKSPLFFFFFKPAHTTNVVLCGAVLVQKEGVTADIVTYNTCVTIAAQGGKLEKALELLRKASDESGLELDVVRERWSGWRGAGRGACSFVALDLVI